MLQLLMGEKFWIQVDVAHGFFHRDVVLPGSEQEKVPQPALDKNLALTDAIAHIKKILAHLSSGLRGQVR